jgi:hypothetical protein
MAAIPVALNLEELDKLGKAIGARNRGEVIRRALGLLALAVERQDGDHAIALGPGRGPGAIRVLLR